jgi:hypothetical protein
MMLPNDKLRHFVASLGLVLVLFLWRKCCKINSTQGALLWACVIGFGISLVKEASDYASNISPWCHPTCQVDTKDIATNVVRVLAGVLVMVSGQLLQLLIFYSGNGMCFLSRRQYNGGPMDNSSDIRYPNILKMNELASQASGGVIMMNKQTQPEQHGF